MVDAETATPFLARRGPSGRASFDSDEELAAAAVHAIEPVVGAEHVRASVHVDYDLSTSEDTSETFDPKATAPFRSSMPRSWRAGRTRRACRERRRTCRARVRRRRPVSPVIRARLTALDSQSSKSQSATYAVSKNIRRVSQPAGRVRRLTASVLIDDASETHQEKDGKTTVVRRKRTPEEMTAIEKLARAAIGVDEQRGDLLALENLSFQTAPIEAAGRRPANWIDTVC